MQIPLNQPVTGRSIVAATGAYSILQVRIDYLCLESWLVYRRYKIKDFQENVGMFDVACERLQ